MCGIAGLINKKNDRFNIEETLVSFKKILNHRGPDDSGTFIHENKYGFINLRLSIVDIASGHQPIFNEQKTMGIVFNGEIYNYLVIRRELEKKGYLFQTKSDTEVILRGFEEYGTELFGKLNGMFAFCIWDIKKDEIYLVRDHFGIKPLYVYQDGDVLVFSSEIKALLSLEGIDTSLDEIGFRDHLTFRYIQAPYTLFKRIKRVEAGTYMRIHNGTAASFRYWDTSYDDPYPAPSLKTVKEELSEILKKAVSSQLMGEVPVGVLLSGGIDSSTIAYIINKLGANLTTFNIGFPEVNEFEYSRKVAKKFGLKHIEVSTTTEELIKDFDAVNLALDEPIADAACLPLYRLCKELKKHVMVVLSGEGGDEVFGGYPQYATLLSDMPPYAERFNAFLKQSWYFDNQDDYLLNRTIPPITSRYNKYFEEQPLLNGMLSYDMRTWMPENLMMKADKILMAHSLEGRFPFLDRELFDYVSRLPQKYKIDSQYTTKWILKEIMKDQLPTNIVTRKKMGFTVPIELLLKKMKPQVLDTANSVSRLSIADVLDIKKIKKNIESYYKGQFNSNPHLKTTFILNIWTLFTLLYWFKFSLPRYTYGNRP